MARRTKRIKNRICRRLLFFAGLCIMLVVCTFAQAKEEMPTASRSEWDELVKAAQKEGAVRIYAGGAIAPLVGPLREAFKRKFGIELEFIQGRPPEVLAKISAERGAGLYLADVGHFGETTGIMDIKPLGISVPLPNLLVLPEVKDPKNWLGGKLPFLDKDGHNIMFTVSPYPHVVVNTDMVKEGELSSMLDLLNPRWKGKIVFSDPTVSGGAPNLLAALFKSWGREKGIKFLRQLATQEPVFTRNQRLLLEWVARAKYPIGIGYSMAEFSQFKKVQAPVKLLNFKEPRYMFAGQGALLIFSKNPHPKAAQLYVNWVLSREGSTLWSKVLEFTSARVDISPEHLDPVLAARADDIFPDEEQLQLRLEMRKICTDIFGPLM